MALCATIHRLLPYPSIAPVLRRVFPSTSGPRLDAEEQGPKARGRFTHSVIVSVGRDWKGGLYD